MSVDILENVSLREWIQEYGDAGPTNKWISSIRGITLDQCHFFRIHERPHNGRNPSGLKYFTVFMVSGFVVLPDLVAEI